jgi:AcrR family transcriptional regulator
MRALAGELGVSPNSLYTHVRSKADLVDELLDCALGGVQIATMEASDPVAGVHAIMTSSYQALLAHADLVPVYVSRQGARGPNAHRLGDAVLELLAEAHLTGEPATDALHVLIVYTIGSAAFATASPLALDPTAAAHAAQRFDNGLRWLLAGLTAATIQSTKGPGSAGRSRAAL